MADAPIPAPATAPAVIFPPAQPVPVPEVQKINWEQPSVADLSAAIPFMYQNTYGWTGIKDVDGNEILKSTVVTLMNKMFIEYADNPAADPQTGISWVSPLNIPTVQRVLERLRVQTTMYAFDEHGYDPTTFNAIKNRK